MFKSIYIEITNACNLNCSFCHESNRNKEYMKVSSFEEILSKIKKYTNYINLHVLGEPLMHPEIDKILSLAYINNLFVNLTTNGRLLNKKIDIINNAKSIRQINISLHSYNDINEIKELLETIDKININCNISYRLWNLGTNNHNDKIINILNDHYQTKIEVKENGFKIKDNIYINFDYQFKWPNIKDEELGSIGTCYGLRTHIGILVDGRVIPCCLDSDGIINLGNIFKDDLDNILNNDKTKEIKEGFLNHKLICNLCKRCHYIKRFRK